MPFLEQLTHALLHALQDTLPLIPFLYLTYLLMELLEHKAGDKVNALVRRSGRVGPLFGGLLGILPQCGFSATAASLYAGRVVSLGTMMAVFLSTSDEMLPILLSKQIPLPSVLLLLLFKAGVAILCGLAIDMLYRPKKEEEAVEDLCEVEGCHCEGRSVFLSALIHTGKVLFFIYLVTFAFGLCIELIGEEQIGHFIGNGTLLGPLLACLIGLVPNCAASVLLTEMHLGGALSLGSMLGGLLVGAGVGLLVLFRTNRRLKENLTILCLLYAIGVLVGILLNVTGLGDLLALV